MIFVLPGAVPVTAEQLPLSSDVIFVCVPLRHWHTLPTPAWEGRIVVDVMNYDAADQDGGSWWEPLQVSRARIAAS